MELEKVNPKITSIEGKVDRIKFLLESIKTTYRLRGIRRALVAEALLICFDKHENEIKNKIINKAVEKLKSELPLEKPCPSTSPHKSFPLIDGKEFLDRLTKKPPPQNRLREAIQYITNLLDKPERHEDYSG